ncbi:hypothetical protein BJY59DRAFT_707476 [Rhodotorula toruloides]
MRGSQAHEPANPNYSLSLVFPLSYFFLNLSPPPLAAYKMRVKQERHVHLNIQVPVPIGEEVREKWRSRFEELLRSKGEKT